MMIRPAPWTVTSFVPWGHFIMQRNQLLGIRVLGIAWAFTSVVGWFSILLTGRFPESLYDFGVGVLRWSTRVEAYGLLLRDEYPPFSLR